MWIIDYKDIITRIWNHYLDELEKSDKKGSMLNKLKRKHFRDFWAETLRKVKINNQKLIQRLQPWHEPMLHDPNQN